MQVTYAGRAELIAILEEVIAHLEDLPELVEVYDKIDDAIVLLEDFEVQE